MYRIAAKTDGVCATTESPSKLGRIMIRTTISKIAKTFAIICIVVASTFIDTFSYCYHHLDMSPRFLCLSAQILRMDSLARRRSVHHRPYTIPPPRPSSIPANISWPLIMRHFISFHYRRHTETRRPHRVAVRVDPTAAMSADSGRVGRFAPSRDPFCLAVPL